MSANSNNLSVVVTMFSISELARAYQLGGLLEFCQGDAGLDTALEDLAGLDMLQRRRQIGKVVVRNFRIKISHLFWLLGV
jgi:hypothetical protein